jgi:CubicO group peptidase (beta-lactamase class C family)
MFILSLILVASLQLSQAQDKLASVLKPYISQETDAILIAQDGKLIHEYYAAPFTKDKRHRSWSMAKTFMVVLAGIMEKDQLIHRDDSVGKCIGDVKFDKIQLKHLMQMTSGIDFLEKYESNPLTSHVVEMLFMPSGFSDMAQYMRQQSVKYEPGEVFNYSSGDSVLLMSCLQQKLPVPLKEYFDTKLFKPLNMPSVFLEYDQQGLWVSASYLYANAQDYLAFGEFLRTAPAALINPEYITWMSQINIQQAHKQHSPQKPYGAGLWMFQATDNLKLKVLSSHPKLKNAYMARGHNGQAIVIIPELAMVVVKLANERNPDDYLPKMLEAIIEQGVRP